MNELVANCDGECRIPIYNAIAYAVSLISPVIIITLTPASLHFSIAAFTSGRGGSYNATIPTIIGFFSKSL